MSEASRLGLYYAKETGAWGVTPAVALKELRYVSHTLGQRTDSTESNEVIATAELRDMIRTAIRAEGGIAVEWSAEAFLDFLEGALRNTWPATLSYTSTLISVNGSNKIQRGTGTWDGAGFRAGQWIKASGFSTSGNNAYYLIKAIQSSGTVLDVVKADGTLPATEGTGASVTIAGTPMVNGTQAVSFTLEAAFPDLAAAFVNFKGMRVGSASLNIAPGSPIGGDFTFLGKNAARTAATVGTGAATAAPTGDVFDPVGSIKGLLENQAAVGTLTGLSLSIATNPQVLPGLATLGPRGISYGAFRVGGQLTRYFENPADMDPYLNWAPQSLSFLLEDPAGKALGVHIPRLRYMDGNPSGPGNNNQTTLVQPWSAMRDATLGCTIVLTKF